MMDSPSGESQAQRFHKSGWHWGTPPLSLWHSIEQKPCPSKFVLCCNQLKINQMLFCRDLLVLGLIEAIPWSWSRTMHTAHPAENQRTPTSPWEPQKAASECSSPSSSSGHQKNPISPPWLHGGGLCGNKWDCPSNWRWLLLELHGDVVMEAHIQPLL